MGGAISATQFYLYGRKYFTQTGYQMNKANYKSPVQASPAIGINENGADGVNLSGRVVVITGANSGVGKELSTYAAAKGATLFMLCRSQERANKAREDILERTKCDPQSVQIVLADLGELKQVRRAVTELQDKTDKVDALICNAGLLLNDRKLTSEGNEVTFATHLLGGSFLLSELLLPQLQKAGKEARVIFVSSGGMYANAFPSWEKAASLDPKKTPYNGQLAYSYAKRGQVLLAETNAKLRHPQITWVSAHPGWSATEAVDLAYGSTKKLLEPLRTPWEGAEGIAWLMSTSTQNIESGAFYLDRQTQRKHLAGPFMSEGSYTKNSDAEVQDMIQKLKTAAEL
jgi:dehydrogenase/reductase SDR family protein 12